MRFQYKIVNHGIIEAENRDTAISILQEYFPSAQVMSCDEDNLQQKQEAMLVAYAEGFKVGLDWLSRGENFLHYNHPNGYVPGGPYNMQYYETEAWRSGWIDGVDASK